MRRYGSLININLSGIVKEIKFHLYFPEFIEKFKIEVKAWIMIKDDFSNSPLLTSERIDPLGQPRVTAGSDNYFRTCPFVRPSVRTHYLKSGQTKQNIFQAETMFTTDETVGLAERIIDDTWLV